MPVMLNIELGPEGQGGGLEMDFVEIFLWVTPVYPHGFQLTCNLLQERFYTSLAPYWPKQNSFALTVTLFPLIQHLSFFWGSVITCLVVDLPI